MGVSEAGAGAGAGVEGAPSAWVTPALMVYYLCCWPGGSDSDTNSEQSHRAVRHESGSHRRASELFPRRMGSSAVSLHLPGTSGASKELLSSHRSHEEIVRRKSQNEHEPEGPSARYHSAPSVIHEVLHRRDWEISTKDLYIPLRPDEEVGSLSIDSLEAPRAEPESSSIEERDLVAKICKKHHTNIKSSKRKERSQVDEDKDSDATELYTFYIGDNDYTNDVGSPRRRASSNEGYQPKEAKQSLNESIRSKDRPRDLHRTSLRLALDDVIDQMESLDNMDILEGLDRLDGLDREDMDRSGATHHTIESRISLSKPPMPPPSVEAVGYEGGACYLAESGRQGAPAGVVAGAPRAAAGALRARHCSDGDILAPQHRPESGAFSESEVELDGEGLHTQAAAGAPSARARETAI